MAEILSNSFKTDVTRLFIDDLVVNDYWLFVSGIDTFAPADSVKSKREFLEKTLFAKRVIESDIHFMIKYYPWQVGQVYVEYDDEADLTGQRFYAVVGPNDNVEIPRNSSETDWEVELGIIIGKKANLFNS